MKRSGLRTGDPGFVGNIGERSIAIVVVQNVASILRHEKIGKAVIIVAAPNRLGERPCSSDASRKMQENERARFSSFGS